MTVPYISAIVPTDAYRMDVERGLPAEDLKEQGAWLITAGLLTRAAESSGPSRRRALREAATWAIGSLGEDAVRRQLERGPPLADAEHDLNVAAMLTSRMEEAGALKLSLACIDAIRAAARHSRLDLGRLNSIRARLLRKLGSPDFAWEMYEEIGEQGEEWNEPELVAQSYLGRMSIQQVRGNYTEVEKWASLLLELPARMDSGS